MKDKQYLGDAVYASFDGEYVNLTTEDGMRATNTICLEPEVMRNLFRYFASIGPGAVDMMREIVAEYAPVETIER